MGSTPIFGTQTRFNRVFLFPVQRIIIIGLTALNAFLLLAMGERRL
jgi:hypothetical protein